MVRRVVRPAAGIALAWWGLGADLAQAQSCAPTGTNQTCTNSTVLSNVALPAAIFDFNTLTVTNTASGVIGTGTTSDGILAHGVANVTNFGTITGFLAVNAGSANVTNSGTIAGAQFGVFTQQDASLTNSGTISSFLGGPGVAGVLSNSGSVTVTNSGTITGEQFAVAAFKNVTVVNSGTMIGTVFGVASPVGNVSVTNSGLISSSPSGVAGVLVGGNVTATNSGTITGAQFGINAQNDINVTNSGTIISLPGGVAGVLTSNGNVTATNSGMIAGELFGIFAQNGSVTATNSGTIAGGQFGIAAFNNLTLANSGSIVGGEVGVLNPSGTSIVTNTGSISGQFGVVGGNLMLSNAGAISGGNVGVTLNATGTVTNSGVITGGEVGVAAVSTASVINSGIISSPHLALTFGGDGSTLTLAQGSTIIGGIEFHGAGNAVHVNAPNQNLTFNTLAGTSVDGSAPFVVVGNRIVSIDPTQFAATDRNLLAVIGAISGIIDSQTQLPAGNGRALGFTGPSYTAATAEEAFADLLGYAKAPNDAVVFKNPSVSFGNGSMVWAKGFIGQRAQGTDGLVLRNVTNFYGGMIGVDGWIAPDLKLGAFGGAGHTSTHIDFNAGSAASDFGFGGIYGRKDFGRVFVDFDVIGGGSSNTTSRRINNNTLASGFETATASFGGWFVSPEIAAGYRHEVWPGFTLTPAARLRYLAAGFDAFTETGSTANLAMGSRIAQALEERVEATLAHVNDLDAWGRLQLAATLGLVGQERIGATTLNATLLGQALAFATPGKSAIGGLYLSGNADWKTPFGATLFAGADYTAYSDASTIVTGRAGARVGF